MKSDIYFYHNMHNNGKLFTITNDAAQQKIVLKDINRRIKYFENVEFKWGIYNCFECSLNRLSKIMVKFLFDHELDYLIVTYRSGIKASVFASPNFELTSIKNIRIESAFSGSVILAPKEYRALHEGKSIQSF